MNEILKGQMEEIRCEEIQVHNHVAVIPMIGARESGPDYLTMKEAMEGHLLLVTEVTEGGTVPELKVCWRRSKGGQKWHRWICCHWGGIFIREGLASLFCS